MNWWNVAAVIVGLVLGYVPYFIGFRRGFRAGEKQGAQTVVNQINGVRSSTNVVPLKEYGHTVDQSYQANRDLSRYD